MVFNPRLNRRSLLSYGAIAATSLLLQPPSWAANLAPYKGPNVILIRFGGGVRRRETIDPKHTYSPFLRHVLTQQGTLFSQMELD